jgi:hypothetical protein
MISQSNFNDIVNFFFHLQILNKLYHWNTTSYARHKATDNFNERFIELVDKFTEVFIGTYNIKPQIKEIIINKDFLTDNGIKELFIFTRKYLISFNNMSLSSDLLNIRDEILAEVNQTLYLFNLS